MNLFIMSPDEIVRWYSPKNPEEKYLVEIISNIDWDVENRYKAENKSLESDIDRLERENQYLEDDVDSLKDENRKLELRIDDLELELSQYKNLVNDLSDVLNE